MQRNSNVSLLTEINRMRQMMGLNLLTESIGTLWADIMGATNRADLDVDQLKLLDDIISKSSNLAANGIRNVDQFLTNKNLALNVLKNSPNTNTLLQKSINDIYGNKFTDEFFDLETTLRQRMESMFGTLPVFKSVIEGDLVSVTETTLRQLKTRIKSSITSTTNTNIKEYLEKLLKNIDDYLNAKNLDINNLTTKSKNQEFDDIWAQMSKDLSTPQLPTSGKIQEFKDKFINGEINLDSLETQLSALIAKNKNNKTFTEKLSQIFSFFRKTQKGVGDVTVDQVGWLKKLTGKETVIGAAVVLALLYIVLMGWDDAADWLGEKLPSFLQGDDIFACLEKIPGWDKVELDTSFADETDVQDFFEAEYEKSEVCSEGDEFSSEDDTVDKIKKFENVKISGIIDREFDITVIYESGCKDKVLIRYPDGVYKIGFEGGVKKCGANISSTTTSTTMTPTTPPPPQTPRSEEGGTEENPWGEFEN